MKKFYLIAAAAAAVLVAGCAKNEVIQTQQEMTPVTFGVYNGRMATKAVSSTTYGQINTNALLQSSAGFGVFAYFSDNSSVTPPATKDYTAGSPSNFYPNFMYNQRVNHDGSAWTYSPIKYWPNEYSYTEALSAAEDKLTFFAYAPYVENLQIGTDHGITISDGAVAPAAATEGIIAMTANNADPGDPILSFKVPAASDKQIDLLYSDADTKNITKQSISGTVHFTFKHALSNLSLYPVAVVDASSIPAGTTGYEGTDLSTGTTITVNSITIQGDFHQEGTLNIATGVWTSSPSSAETVTYSPASAYDVTDINDKDEADTAGPCAEFMFIPSASTSYTVTIDYDVTYAAASSGLAENLVVKNVIHKPINLTFVKGQKTKLYIGLGMTSVTFSAEVGNWADGTEPTIWLPVNTD